MKLQGNIESDKCCINAGKFLTLIRVTIRNSGKAISE
jgi:hypothetical protein